MKYCRRIKRIAARISQDLGSRYARSRGVSVLEVVVGLGVLSVVISAVVSLASQTVRAGSAVRQDLIAANLAQEGLELVRSIRDGNWIAGRRADGAGIGAGCQMSGSLSGNWRNRICDRSGSQFWTMDSNDSEFTAGTAGNGLRLNGTTGEYEYEGSGVPTPYTREIRLTTVSDQQVLVEATVRWCPTTVSLRCGILERSLTLRSFLYNWAPSP